MIHNLHDINFSLKSLNAFRIIYRLFLDVFNSSLHIRDLTDTSADFSVWSFAEDVFYFIVIRNVTFLFLNEIDLWYFAHMGSRIGRWTHRNITASAMGVFIAYNIQMLGLVLLIRHK